MSHDEMLNLEKLMNFLAYSFMKKKRWQDISKTEWRNISLELIAQVEKGTRYKKDIRTTDVLGENYIYEHLIQKKLKPYEQKKQIKQISTPSSSKLETIACAVGFGGYIDFINNAHEMHHYDELKINIPSKKGRINLPLLENLIGHWYSYNRNVPGESRKGREERIWRSAMQIFRQGDEYLIERTGNGNHDYYGKIVAYEDYVFIIMNSTMFTRQRHFISRIKDVNEKLARKGFNIDQMHFVSTCVGLNDNPMALFEIFERVQKADLRNFEHSSVDLPFDSPSIPPHILAQLKDIERNRIIQH